MKYYLEDGLQVLEFHQIHDGDVLSDKVSFAETLKTYGFEVGKYTVETEGMFYRVKGRLPK